MNKTFRTAMALVLGLLVPTGMAAQTLQECWAAAERNYPLVRERGIIEATTELTLENIRKGWLPQLTATAQGTLQSDVAAWPGQMRSMLSGMGVDVKGLRKDQYRVGVDVSQLVWDGGRLRSQQKVARQQGSVDAAQTEVSLYQVRRRVNEMYFGLLLLGDQASLCRDRVALLEASERKLLSMFQHGTAAECDYQSLRAERLEAEAQLTNVEGQRETLRRLLTELCGMEVTNPRTPQATAPLPSPQGGRLHGGYLGEDAVSPLGGTEGGPWPSLRPELLLFSEQLRLAELQERALDAKLLPRVGLFATGYYGYPGYNMFEDMMLHRWSLNGLIGARLTWDITPLYTRRTDKARLARQRERIGVQREVFLLNNRLEVRQQADDAARFRTLMAADEEIISLRASVRRAAESKLEHGIIDATGLIRDINQENAARLSRSQHELQMLKAEYDKAITLNTQQP